MTSSNSFPEADWEVEDREFKVPVGSLRRKRVGRERIWKVRVKGALPHSHFHLGPVLTDPHGFGASCPASEALGDKDEETESIFVGPRQPQSLAFQAKTRRTTTTKRATVKDCILLIDCLPNAGHRHALSLT